MPFYYSLPMPALDGIDSTEAVLDRWIAEPGQWVERDTPLAKARVGGIAVDVLAAGPGVFAKALCSEGTAVQVGDAIATIHADGESIPYGRAYSSARRA